MAGRRRRSDDLDDDFAALIMVGLILIGLFGYMHKLPPRIIIAGHQMLVALSPSLAQSVESAFPKGHADLGDLVPYAGLLLGFAIVLLIVSRPSQRRARLRMRTLGELLTLTPGQFEDAVAELLRAQGYRHVKIVGGLVKQSEPDRVVVD